MGSRWLNERRRVLLVVAGHTAFCTLLSLGVVKGLPYSSAVVLIGPVLLAAATLERRVYLALLPQTALGGLVSILVRAPNRGEALVALTGLAVTASLLAELLFRIASAQRRTTVELRRRIELQEALHTTALGLLQGSAVEPLLEEILRRACALLGTPHGNLYLVEGDVLRGWMGLGKMRWVGEERIAVRKGEGMVGRVWETGEPLVVEEYARWPGRLPDPRFDRLHHAVAVPLKVREEVVGVFSVARDDPDQPFRPEELEAILWFGELASLVLQNASLYRAAQEELERRLAAETALRHRQELLEALHATTYAMLHGIRTEEILHTLTHRASQLLRSPHGNVYLLEAGRMRCKVGLGAVAWTEQEGFEVRKGEGMVGRVWETGKPLVVEDYARWPGRLPDSRFDVLGSAVAVPLAGGGEVIGALLLARDRSEAPFTPDEVETVVRLGELSALVLQHARLVEQTELAARTIQEQKEFYEVILHTIDTSIAVFDLQLRYVYANPSAVRDPELREWVIGRDDDDYCRRKGWDPAMAARRQEMMRKALQEKRMVEFEEVIPTPTGEERYFLRRVCPVLNAQGEVVRLIRYGLDITDRKRVELQLQYQALHDALTGLPNRTLFLDRLHQALERTPRTGTQVAVLFVDLDRFKLVNDSLGHAAGDQLLVEASKRLGACLRASDTLARLAGDEFVVLAEVQSPADAARIAERLLASVRPAFLLDGEEVYLTASIGIAVGDWTRRPEDLLREADTAMYRAKAAGRNRYWYFEEAMHLEALRQLQLETDLRRALEREEFVVYYQPVVRIADRMPVEMEALLRWNHPRRGLVPASEFLVEAERMGFGDAIGQWVMEQACRQARSWVDQFPDREIVVSIPLTASQLKDPAFANHLTELLRSTGTPSHALRLEIPAATLLALPPEATDRLKHRALPALAVRVDQEGVPLELLSQLAIRTVKVSWPWVSGSQKTFGHLRGLADALGANLVATQVEDPEEVGKAAAMGFAYVEGKGVAAPMDPEAATRYLAQSGKDKGTGPPLGENPPPAAGTSEPPVPATP